MADNFHENNAYYWKLQELKKHSLQVFLITVIPLLVAPLSTEATLSNKAINLCRHYNQCINSPSHLTPTL